nr:hypothetical protein [Propionicimonas sp.]
MIGRVAVRAAAAASVLAVLFAGGLLGLRLLPVAVAAVHTGELPDGPALKVSIGTGVRLRVATTAGAGGSPRYEFATTGVVVPPAPTTRFSELVAACPEPSWPWSVAPSCRADLLVVVDAGRPVRIEFGPDSRGQVWDDDVDVQDLRPAGG